MNSFEAGNLFLPNLASLRLCGRQIRISESSITGKFAQAARYDKHVGVSFWIAMQKAREFWERSRPSFTLCNYFAINSSGAEVDFVVQSRTGLLPIEVKMSSRAQLGDIRSLEAFLDEYPKDARFGVLLYGGDAVVTLTPRIVALPVRAIL